MVGALLGGPRRGPGAQLSTSVVRRRTCSENSRTRLRRRSARRTLRPLDDETAAGALEAAWDSGIRYFDTSPHYGIGHSERRIGDLLRDRPRDEFTLSTKVGRLLVPQDPAGRMDEASRCRPPTAGCGTSPGTASGAASRTPSPDGRRPDRRAVPARRGAAFRDALRHGYPALAELRAEGVVGAIGAGMYHPGMLTRLVRRPTSTW